MRNPHPHILTGHSPAAGAGRFTPQQLGGSKPHILSLSESRKQHRHDMPYPLQPQLRTGFNSQPPQIGSSNASSLLLNRLPLQEPKGQSHHSSILRSLPDSQHSAYHHNLNSSDVPLRHQRPLAHYQNRQSRLYHEQRIATDQLRSDREKMHLNAILMERAEEEEKRHRAQELLYHVDGMAPEAHTSPTASSTSVEELKQRLLVAARALGAAQCNGLGTTTTEGFGGMLHGESTCMMRGGAATQESLNAMMHGGGMGQLGAGSSAPIAHHQLHNRTLSSHQPPQQRVNFPTLMSVLEQTQKVAAAAHEQSAILQKFAQDLEQNNGMVGGGNGNGGPWRYENSPAYFRN